VLWGVEVACSLMDIAFAGFNMIMDTISLKSQSMIASCT
jgi:hypothetical protein